MTNQAIPDEFKPKLLDPELDADLHQIITESPEAFSSDDVDPNDLEDAQT